MQVRLKPSINIQDRSASWLTHGTLYQAEWAPGWPKHPRHVRVFRPDDPSVYVEVSVEALEEVGHNE
jgi:hypothetical protein